MALIATTRRYSFRAVHSLNSGEHKERFHGHEYFLEVSFQGCAPTPIDEWTQQNILSACSGHDLTSIVAPATGEVLVEWIQSQFDKSPLAAHILAIALQETRKNRFVSARSNARFV
jgi:hypothetical protein